MSDFNLEARARDAVDQIAAIDNPGPAMELVFFDGDKIEAIINGAMRDALQAAEDAAREVAAKATDRPDLGIDSMGVTAGALKAADAIRRLR